MESASWCFLTIYTCKYWSNTCEKPDFERIYTDDMNDLTKVYRNYVNNLTRKEKYETELEKSDEIRKSHVIDQSDPLFSVIGYSNGNKH